MLLLESGRNPRSSVIRGLLGLMVALAGLLGATPIFALTIFEDVHVQAGIDYAGVSKGASWGDFNGDGWPDLWTCNHNTQPSLYLNNGDGTFTNIILDVWSDSAGADTHGAAWGDADNDGDEDLLQLVGAAFGEGSHPNRAFINDQGILRDAAAELGLQYPDASGYTPLWFDGNDDGLLDAFLCNRRRYPENPPSTVFLNKGQYFLDVGPVVGFSPERGPNFAILSDLSGDGRLDLIQPGYPFPLAVLDIREPVFTDLLPQIPGLPVDIQSLITDAVAADLNGDLVPDLFMTGDKGGSDVFQSSDQELDFTLKIYTGPKGFDFQTQGPVSFELFPHPWLSRLHIFVGAGGVHPPDLAFTLDPGDTMVWGMAAPDSTMPDAFYVGYDPDLDLWQVGAPLPDGQTYNGRVTSEGTMTLMETHGFHPFAPYSQDYTVLSSPQGYITTLLPKLTACGSVVAGDFDNDMDLDIYMVSSGPVANLPNILYRNLGDGTFEEVPDAGGAAGTRLGEGESVAMADYDRDGFLDLFVANGDEYGDFGNGPYQLFHNLAGTRQDPVNHWLELDLQGTVSNRDGIGARVIAYAGGVAQLREQNGGMHKYSQNFMRLHFGLGSNTVVDSLQVSWQSGLKQTLYHVPVDTILMVVEPAAKSLRAVTSVTEPGRPDAVKLTGVFPNPFNPRTTIEFELATGDQVDLAVYDLAGRRVAGLAQGYFPAGTHRVQWNGKSSTGGSPASGTYYCRLSVAGEVRVRKMVLVR